MSPQIILALGALVLGAILGSFINALSFRFNTGRVATLFSPTSSGRSRCMRCGHVLHAADLVPIFSWITLAGRCRYCGSRISLQYPLVEAIAALASLILFLTTQSLSAYAFVFLVALVLLFIAVYDMRHAIIPWSASIVLLVLSVAYLAWHMPAMYDLLAGPVLALPLFLLWFISRGRWMGLGDSVLELSLGSLLGLTAGLTAFLFAFWLGAAVGIILMLLRRGVTMSSEVPFAPFLIAGAAAAYIFHVDLFQSLPLLF